MAHHSRSNVGLNGAIVEFARHYLSWELHDRRAVNGTIDRTLRTHGSRQIRLPLLPPPGTSTATQLGPAVSR